MKLITSLFCVVTLGCTQISTNGEIKNSHVFIRQPKIYFNDDSLIKYYRIKSIGAGMIENNLVIGYSSLTRISIRDTSKCSILIFVKNRKEFEDIEADLFKIKDKINNLCVFSEQI